MATGDSGDTLESWLNKATDPTNAADRWDCIQGFYELINKETEGPQNATRLLAHKIQSPQPREALQALTVLEACMNNCGKPFHCEAAKFRFLNELIKVLSPKFLGPWSPAEVKQRVTEVLYSWTLWLKDEPKVQEAYRMLKKQGIVKKDPKFPETIVMPPPSPRTEGSVFDEEDKSKLLARLLKSNCPEDLQRANRLIKNTIIEEQEKAEKVFRRESTLEEVKNSTRQLRELLDQHRTGTPTQHTDHMKALYERCDRLRPNLFRLASDPGTDDEVLAQILQANDELTLAVNIYKETVVKRRTSSTGGGTDPRNNVPGPTSPREIKSYHLIDLSALDSPRTHRRTDTPPPPCLSQDTSPLSSPPSHPSLDSTLLSLVDQELTALGLDKPIPTQSLKGPRTYYDELTQLSGGDSMKGTEAGRDHSPTERVCEGRDVSLIVRGSGGGSGSWNGTDSWAFLQNQPMAQSGSPVKLENLHHLPESLADIYVPLESIRPSRLEPITVYYQGGVHVSLHFAKDTPAGHPTVAVVIVSAVNTSVLPVRDILFQAAVPKTMKVKLQPSSGKDLPPYNPLLPPSATSQILLLSNPQRRTVRLRYKLTLTYGEQRLSEMGTVEDFPDWMSWMGL